ncbi:MAG: YfhO family protein, partial [bacterium]
FFQELGLELDPEPLVRGERFLYLNHAALPRARLVDRYVLADNLPGGGELAPFLVDIQSGRHDYRQQVVLDRAPSPAPEAVSGSLPSPEYVRDGINEVVLRTDASTPAILLLADMYTPGWQVEVDGQARELLRADGILRAVALSAGEHEVRFSFRDDSLRFGLTLTGAGLGCVLLLLLLPSTLLARFRRSAGTRSAGT